MNQDSYRAFQSHSGVPLFWAEKYAQEANKNWDKFYKRNSTNFYKDRHWTSTQSSDGFPCLSDPSPRTKVLVEAGCGVANCAFPLLDINSSLFVYAFDFASTAIELVRSSPKYNTNRMHAFLWDFCRKPICDVKPEERGELRRNVADFCTLIFVLSSVPVELQVNGLRNLFQLLRPGGRLLFRDYATGDLAEARFAIRNKIADNYFVRQDSTLAYFFSEARLRHLAEEAGFEVFYIRRVTRTIRNRKEEKEMNRIFLQAEFIKPMTAATEIDKASCVVRKRFTFLEAPTLADLEIDSSSSVLRKLECPFCSSYEHSIRVSSSSWYKHSIYDLKELI